MTIGINDAILTLNAGSSSLKFALFDATGAIMRGQIENLHDAPHFSASDAAGKTILQRNDMNGDQTFPAVMNDLLTFIDSRLGANRLIAAGHRVVQGGANHIAPERVTPALRADLAALTDLDPLHMPGCLALMQTLSELRPTLPQIACFDTAFHHTLPPVAQRFALPRALHDAGIRRYGFHGLSYEYIALSLRQDAPDLARGRVIAAHLGSGASLCALRHGVSIATTTGFSALDGLMMATRCGRLDPGAILYLAAKGENFSEIEDILYRQSGLLGVSGISGDIRILLASPDPRAAEAIELFTYITAIEAGGMVSALGGLDGIVFTAGIGEHAPAIREMICTRLAWLGVTLDASANAAGAARISTANSAVEVRIIATDEEAMIARHTRQTAAPAMPVNPPPKNSADSPA